jgi:salicylate biosynthesis isochorismate synthase
VSDFFAPTLERLSSQTSASTAVVAIAAPAAIVSPVRLVSAYRGELSLSFWHAAPRANQANVGIVGFGEAIRFDARGADRTRLIADEAKAMFSALGRERTGTTEDAPGPFVVGGLSFRPGVDHEPWADFADASFVLPRWTYVCRDQQAWWWLCIRPEDVRASKDEIIRQWMELQHALLIAQTPILHRPPSTSVVRFDVADRDAYCALVAEAIACIRTRETDKIVAVTSSRVTFGEPVDPRAVLERLDETYPDTTRFAIQRGERVFVGASPERLVARHGRHIDSDGLAGTARRSADDGVAIRTLLSSTKDRREHALVVESIAAVLGPRCSALDVPDEPRVRTLRNVHHLWTPIRGVLRNETHVLDLVQDLHPTPAVAGTPRDRATAWIAEHEMTSRGWYTGAVGYFDGAGDGEFAVAIRAGLVGKNEAFLYAGAGIVEASDPPAEYAETRAKEAPMLAALGISP